MDTIKGKNYFLVFCCFFLPWFVFYIFILLLKEIIIGSGDSIWHRIAKYPQQINFWLNFVPCILMFILGISINFLINNFQPAGTNKLLFKLIILICILAGIDQFVQLYIVMHHDSVYISVIKNWLEINPKSMIQSSSEFISIGQAPSLIRFLLYFICVSWGIFLFRLLNHFYTVRSHFYLSIVFYVSGFICSFLDTILYNNGYDYIHINKLIVFDIKDIYLFIGVSLFFQSVGMNIATLKKLTGKDILRVLPFPAGPR